MLTSSLDRYGLLQPRLCDARDVEFPLRCLGSVHVSLSRGLRDSRDGGRHSLATQCAGDWRVLRSGFSAGDLNDSNTSGSKPVPLFYSTCRQNSRKCRQIQLHVEKTVSVSRTAQVDVSCSIKYCRKRYVEQVNIDKQTRAKNTHDRRGTQPKHCEGRTMSMGGPHL